MNYARAIKLLYRVENPELVQYFGGDPEGLELALERMARRKFRFWFLCKDCLNSKMMKWKMLSSYCVLT